VAGRGRPGELLERKQKKRAKKEDPVAIPKTSSPVLLMLARFLRSVGLVPATPPIMLMPVQEDGHEEPAVATPTKAAAAPSRPKRRRAASPPPTPRLLVAPRTTRSAAAARTVTLLHVPRAVIQVEVVPHLDAKSLVSLRMACREIREIVVSDKKKEKAHAPGRASHARVSVA